LKRPKPQTSICDSILLKVNESWKCSSAENTSNINLVREIERNKACFFGKDSTEIGKIFGTNRKLTNYKLSKNALFYEVKLERDVQSALLFVLDDKGCVDDIDTVYLDSGDTVK
jgi:hypothetical protein